MDNTLELTTTSILSLFDTTKEQRHDFVMRVVESLDSGNSDALNTHFQVKCMESIIKDLNENTRYKSSVLAAVESYGQKSFEYRNSKVEVKEVGVKYDFSKCEDPILVELYRRQEELKVAVKARETLLKAVSEKGMILTEAESGETFTVYPPAKSSTTSVAITLK
jgi:hypothetical protein